jgi:uncharacterized protein YjiS (DUF1127 family)
MRYSADSDDLTTQEEAAFAAVATRIATPRVIAPHRDAGNDDAFYAAALASVDDAASWARHARAANGFGEAMTAPVAGLVALARPASYPLYQAGRAHRSTYVGRFVVAAMRAVVAYARRAYARHVQRRDARLVYDALRRLDDRTLRDLGFDRSEILSVAAEATGVAERTRVRALLMSD